jgi:NADH-quinone oxidoreductase subunit L
MTYPLIALAVLSGAGGLLLAGDWIVDWLTPVVGEHVEHHLAVGAFGMSLIALAVVAVGVAVAWFLVGQRRSRRRRRARSPSSPGLPALTSTATPSTTRSS